MTQREDMQTAIGDATTIFVAQDADGHGLMLWPNDLKDIFAQLAAAERREQQLIEAAKKILEQKEPLMHLARVLADLYPLSTLYPDTPAPTDPNAVLEQNGIDPTGWTWHTPAPKEE